MNRSFFILLLIAGLLLTAGPARADDPLVQKVKRAIERGIDYLAQRQRLDGSWEISKISTSVPGGETCLTMLALLEAGVTFDGKYQDIMERGLKKVRALKSLNKTYARALQTMVLSKAGRPVDKVQITKNVEWLIEARVIKGGALHGWTYGKSAATKPDNSNTQYALLGLLAGKEAGVEISQEVWKSIRNYYQSTQLNDGGWTYKEGEKNPFGGGSTMTMTTAGLCGLIIAGAEIQEGREKLQDDGPTLNCGRYNENTHIAKALTWLGKNFHFQIPGRTMYNFYGIERAGRLSGLRFFGRHDWYREGCEFLVSKQLNDGSWRLGKFTDQWPVISTSFALLFLSKGRTPILISRLVHGAFPRDPTDNDWNRDRNAMKHLTEHISKNLFTKRDKQGNIQPMPLAWQIFDLMQAAYARGGATTEKALQEITSEMLQSPIIFINGHDAPRLTDREKDLLKRYVENGGFIIAEACCGSEEFDRGFRQLVQEMWPHSELAPLPADHSIWRFPAAVKPGAFKLHGLTMGCKTVLVYAREDMSCRWEGKDLTSAKGQLAFRVGTNIVAYATKMVPPLPRLTEFEVASAVGSESKTPPRFFLKVAQLHYRRDWLPPAPKAMRNLMSHLRKYAGMDVVLQPEKMTIDHEDLSNFKFIYFHDRAGFDFGGQSLEQLQFNLKTGGLLFADACCGNKKFDASFREFVKRLLPKYELQKVKDDDLLFSAKLNGVALTKDNIKCRTEPGQEAEPMAPLLEGIKIDGRWVVLYSKYDIGCALERHQSLDCIGYDHESALRIAGAAVLYLMSPLAE